LKTAAFTHTRHRIKGRAKPLELAGQGNLTPRENEVFDLIVMEGLDNQEISDSLGISVRSAKFHVGNVLRKMGTADRLKLTVTYWRAKVEGRAPRGASKARKMPARRSGGRAKKAARRRK
jgi:DNA-binding NarL/FixJ family response regulator